MLLLKILKESKGLKNSFQFSSQNYNQKKHLQYLSNRSLKSMLDFIKSRSKTLNISEDHFIVERLWIKDCIPTLKKNRDYIIKNNMLGDLFQYCFRIKLNSNDIFSLGQDCINGQLSLDEYIQMYATLIQLKYRKNLHFLESIRNLIIKQISKMEVIEKKDVENYLKFIQYLLIDDHLSRSKKQVIVYKITEINQQTLQNIRKVFSKKMSTLSTIHQAIKLYKLKLSPKFSQLSLDAYLNIDNFIKQNPNNSNSLQKMSQTMKVNHDKKIYQSVFEKFFQNRLKDAGFNFQISPIIKGNQYDFSIIGKYKQKFCPLAHLDLNSPPDPNRKQWKPFPLQKLFMLNKCPDDQFEIKPIRFNQIVIINLNGRRHYIQSDMLPKDSICRKEQFKYQKLILYQITKYNIINHTQWEEVDRYQEMSKQFISKKINQPINLTNKNKSF